MKEGNELTWAQVVMAANAPVMTKAALVEGRTDVGVLPTGQVVGVLNSLPTVADIVGGIMAEADAVLRGWCERPRARRRRRSRRALPWATRRSRFDTRWCVTPKRWAMLGMLCPSARSATTRDRRR